MVLNIRMFKLEFCVMCHNEVLPAETPYPNVTMLKISSQ